MNSTKTKQIYQLVDPRTGKPFYVGQALDANKRLEQHIEDAYDSPTRKRIKEIIDTEQLPLVEVIETVPESIANKREQELVKIIDGLTNISYNSGQKGRKKRNAKEQAAWAIKLLPKAQAARDRAYHKRKAQRTVPEITNKAWDKIKHLVDGSQDIDINSLVNATGYTANYISSRKWIYAIAREFDNWELVTVGLGGSGYRRVLRRVSP